MNGLGGRIRARRKELKLTLRELARKCGLSATFLCEVELGKRGIGADSLLAVGQAVGLPLDQLMKGDGPQISGVEVRLPGSLMRFALEADIPFRQALCLYWMFRTINDHRAAERRENPEAFDWMKFHAAVKAFL